MSDEKLSVRGWIEKFGKDYSDRNEMLKACVEATGKSPKTAYIQANKVLGPDSSKPKREKKEKKKTAPAPETPAETIPQESSEEDKVYETDRKKSLLTKEEQEDDLI